MPRIVGLTGGIACGKSSVASVWKSAGIYIIDADAIAREVVAPGQPALWLIRCRFGPSVIQADGALDRAALGRIVFSDASARAALNLRIHPFIVCTMLSRLATAILFRCKTIVVLDTPLLYESKTLLPFCSQVVVVSCEPEQQISRMLVRDGESKGVSEEDARKRLASQMPLEEKVRRADLIIDNSGDTEQLKERALQVLNELQPSAAGELAFRALVCGVAARIAVRIACSFYRRVIR